MFSIQKKKKKLVYFLTTYIFTKVFYNGLSFLTFGILYFYHAIFLYMQKSLFCGCRKCEELL